MDVNYQLLREDLKFPLKWDLEDYKMYIFDDDDNMVLQVDHDNLDATKEYHPFEKIKGQMIDVGELQFPPKHRYFIHQGDFYDQEKGIRIGCVRGWGRLQQKKKGTERQDNIANYVLFILNNGKDEDNDN